MLSNLTIPKSSNFLLQEARSALSKETDLTILCKNFEKMSTSRILFGLLLQPELQRELWTNENTCLILEDVSLKDLQNFINNAFFKKGIVQDLMLDYFKFINWDLFKGPPEIDTKKESFECPICGKMLSDKKSLKRHEDAVHLNIRNHYCIQCGKRFITKNDLLDHIRSVHEKIRAFICDSCGQALSSRHGLRMHKLIHKEGTKSIPCSKCDKNFRHLSTYRKHIARVHDFDPNKKLKCDFCLKLFNHTEGLKRHLKKFHTIEKPEYQCDLCPQAFVFNYDLNKHKKRAHKALLKPDDIVMISKPKVEASNFAS